MTDERDDELRARVERDKRIAEVSAVAERDVLAARGVDPEAYDRARRDHLEAMGRVLQTEADAWLPRALRRGRRLRDSIAERDRGEGPEIADATEESIRLRERDWFDRPTPWDEPVRVRACGLDRFEPCSDLSVQTFNDMQYEPAERNMLVHSVDGCDTNLSFTLISTGEHWVRQYFLQATERYELVGSSWRDPTPWCLRPRVSAAGLAFMSTGFTETTPLVPLASVGITVYMGVNSGPDDHVLAIPVWHAPIYARYLGPSDQVSDVIAASSIRFPALRVRPRVHDLDGPRKVKVLVWTMVGVSVTRHAISVVKLGGVDEPGLTVGGLDWSVTADFEPLLPIESPRRWGGEDPAR